MRNRTVALLFAAGAATGAAVIGAATATLLSEASADRIDRAYTGLSELFWSHPAFRRGLDALEGDGNTVRPARPVLKVVDRCYGKQAHQNAER
jgi:hypothetical protein